ncbi:hypothetical protein OKW28_004944 [Paraburkholderia sp. 40]
MERPSGLNQNDNFTARPETAGRAGAISLSRQRRAPVRQCVHALMSMSPHPATTAPRAAAAVHAAVSATVPSAVAAMPSAVPAVPATAMPSTAPVPIPMSVITARPSETAIDTNRAVRRSVVRRSIRVGIVGLRIAVVRWRRDDASSDARCRGRYQRHRCNEPGHDFLLHVNLRKTARNGVQPRLCPSVTGASAAVRARGFDHVSRCRDARPFRQSSRVLPSGVAVTLR